MNPVGRLQQIRLASFTVAEQDPGAGSGGSGSPGGGGAGPAGRGYMDVLCAVGVRSDAFGKENVDRQRQQHSVNFG